MARALIWTALTTVLWTQGATADRRQSTPHADDRVAIQSISPDKRGGTAYKLVYTIGVPIDVLWKFKTDFKNDFLVTNKYIREHHLVYRKRDWVITENKYTNAPDVFFKWRTTVFPRSHRLEFVLMNPEECKQRYHYGHIELEAVKGGTRVTQVAYFDFWGASFWAAYPWGGGMRDFLTYNANWERREARKFERKYLTIDRRSTPANEGGK